MFSANNLPRFIFTFSHWSSFYHRPETIQGNIIPSYQEMQSLSNTVIQDTVTQWMFNHSLSSLCLQEMWCLFDTISNKLLHLLLCPLQYWLYVTDILTVCHHLGYPACLSCDKAGAVKHLNRSRRCRGRKHTLIN